MSAPLICAACGQPHVAGDDGEDLGNPSGGCAGFVDPRDDGSLWQTVSMTCAVCSHAWQAVFPIEVPGLECPSCSYMNEVPV